MVSCEEEHVAVLDVDVGLFDVDGEGEVDEGKVAYKYFVLQVEGSECRHIGICMVFGEILYGDHGLEGCRFFEDGL